MGRKTWTDQQLQQLQTLWRTHTSIEIAEMMGKTHVAVQGKAKELGLKRTANERAELVKRNAGCFKKGNLPHNAREPGTILRRGSCGYFYIKLDDGSVVEYHRHLYESANGAVSEDMAIIGVKTPLNKFKTAKALKTAFERGEIQAISRSELAVRNNNRLKAMHSIRKTWQTRKVFLLHYLLRLIVLSDTLEDMIARANALSLIDPKYSQQATTWGKRLHSLKMAYAKSLPQRTSTEFFLQLPRAI